MSVFKIKPGWRSGPVPDQLVELVECIFQRNLAVVRKAQQLDNTEDKPIAKD